MQAFIGLAQLALSLTQECLVLVFLTSTQSSKTIKAHIDADGWSWGNSSRVRQLHLDGNKPPIGRFGHACPQDLTLKAQVFRQIDPSQFGYPETMITDLKLIVGQIKTGFAFFLPFEFRTTDRMPIFQSCKESRPCLPQIEKG